MGRDPLLGLRVDAETVLQVAVAFLRAVDQLHAAVGFLHAAHLHEPLDVAPHGLAGNVERLASALIRSSPPALRSSFRICLCVWLG